MDHVRARSVGAVHLRSRRAGPVDLGPRLGPGPRRPPAGAADRRSASRSGSGSSCFMDAGRRDGAARTPFGPTASSFLPEPYAAAHGSRESGAELRPLRRRGAGRVAAGARRQRRPRSEPRQPRRLPARRPRRARGVDRPRARLRALELGYRETVHEYLRCIAAADGRPDDRRHRHRPLRRPPHRGDAQAARRAFAERVLGTREIDVPCPQRACSAARGLRYLATRFSAREAFSKAVGLGHPDADDLARVRDRQRGERQARDCAERRAGGLVRRAPPRRARQP